MKFLNEQPREIKIVLASIIAVLALIFIIWLVLKLLKKDSSSQAVTKAEKEIKESDLNYSDAEYQSMADSLFTAMDGIGTDTDIIIDVFFNRIKSASDYYSIFKAFGVKKASSFLSSFKGNLAEWLADEKALKTAPMYLYDKIKQKLNILKIAI